MLYQTVFHDYQISEVQSCGAGISFEVDNTFFLNFYINYKKLHTSENKSLSSIILCHIFQIKVLCLQYVSPTQ